jgi:hypothetical protein
MKFPGDAFGPWTAPWEPLFKSNFNHGCIWNLLEDLVEDAGISFTPPPTQPLQKTPGIGI